MQKLTHWLRTVARAAPPMPMRKVKMKSGSSAMLSSPPVHSPHIASTASPSARRMLLSTKEEHITGAPSRIQRA